MSDYILSCCSTADLSKEHFEARDIKYICFHYKLNRTDYLDDLGQSIPFEEFYRRMDSGEDTQTSQINVTEYLEYFESFLNEGKDIIHLTLSSGISGSYNSAINAAKIAKERHPERKIHVIDSLAASSGYGLLMDKLADLRDGGMDIDELRSWAEENKLRLQHWFFSSDLKFFIKGGRISKTAGTIGTILGICPLLEVDSKGRLTAKAKIRTRKKVIREIVKRMEENAENGYDYSGKCYISQSACPEDANEVAKLVEKYFPNLEEKVLINYVGTTIGSHTGPGTVALFFWGKERED